jgi:peptidoglycan/xylan/chitin deacetylase (PgdA/CDA1 family)
MISDRMAIGSHTHTHRILSKLCYKEQVNELQVSKMTIESEIKEKIDTVAFPVGDCASINSDTLKALKISGYNAAFSYCGGINKIGRMQLSNI